MNLQSDFDILHDAPYRIPYRKGFVAGAFDIIHPGYIAMFEEAKRFCQYLIVAVNIDPSLENPDKMRPILSWKSRVEILRAIQYVDEVHVYWNENDLHEFLKDIKPDVRFLGDDYKDGAKPITGAELNIPIHWIKRSEWSATRFKQLIYEQMKERQ